METFIGTIMLFGFDFAPQGWAKCDGQLLSISQNSALFSLIGTTYGGNGQTTFALPDLRGRVPLGVGQGPGLSVHLKGQTGGTESVTMTAANLPSHTHSLMASTESGNSSDPSGNVLANAGFNDLEYTSAGPNTQMSSRCIGTSGGNIPINNMQPYLAMNYCISLYGIFPPRD
ncbi:phage tail protein [Persicitalea jodogahamensis]|uniref:Tail Collar domain-containing protein n=1 Tax=Persicitalea jodogahamensis TaxID=402147 RepID=A0A8J3D7S0_9BACT|nr:tail fiber protein [Persicitalea jodogahamensis]GHB58194.1 tail Collar domain-containing protein [Persicitalea jodogahamensis]